MTWTVGIIIYIVVSFVVGIIVGRAIHYINGGD
jgi:hypothetical protein